METDSTECLVLREELKDELDRILTGKLPHLVIERLADDFADAVAYAIDNGAQF